MRVKIASDVHGAFDLLARGLARDDLFIGLGDYLNLVDYDNLDGILPDILGRDRVARVIEALARGDKKEARRVIADITGSNPRLFQNVMEQAVLSYRRLVESLPCESYLIWGNVDVPHLLAEAVDGVDRIEIADNLVTTIGSTKVGLLSGAPPGPFSFGLPGERPAREYSEILFNMGEVDVLFVHVPPADSDLSYDVRADRDEEGSSAVSDFIERLAPGRIFFGHVHSPRASEKRLHQTLCLNVGHFRSRGSFVEIDL